MHACLSCYLLQALRNQSGAPGVDERREGRVFLEDPGDVRVEEAVPGQAKAAPPVLLQVISDRELQERHAL